jgi:hypothetical protein
MPLLDLQKKYRALLQRLFPASRAYTGWRFDQLSERLDQIEGRRLLDDSPGEAGPSPKLQEEILAVLRLLEPRKANDYKKIRVGTAGDGGYVQLDDFAGISHALSFGVGDNDDWDVAMAKTGIAVEQFDHTVARAPSTHPLLRFHRKMISVHAGPQTATLSDLVAEHSRRVAPDLILKMDIENSEWDIFDRTDETVLVKFAQILCEFHNLSLLMNRRFRSRARRVFEKLARHFAPIHVHGNNCGRIANLCNIPVPEYLEVTFASRIRYSFADSDEKFPTPLDAPNAPAIPSIVLGTFRF